MASAVLNLSPNKTEHHVKTYKSRANTTIIKGDIHKFHGINYVDYQGGGDHPNVDDAT